MKIKILCFICILCILCLNICALNAQAGTSLNIVYNYDNLNRLTSVNYNNGNSIKYVYDDAGNITNILPTVTQGRVVDKAGNPIVGATVKLYDNTGKLISTVITDSNGEFPINAPSEGSYYIVVTASGYKPYDGSKSPFNIAYGSTLEIPVTLDKSGKSMPWINLLLSKASLLKSRLY
ncbi:MAG: carboxypeptidase regulatory-like domain-containing protein [Desulfobacterales bacterium]|nr:carboxypeptidase regulatory-like domain-containing protein [Desulfobacterales bacterium]